LHRSSRISSKVTMMTFLDQPRKTCLKKIDSVDCLKESSPMESQKSMLTLERAIKHEHDHM
jgi:hypothetical protein